MQQSLWKCAAAVMLAATCWAADPAAPTVREGANTPARGVDVGVCAVVKAGMDEATMRQRARLIRDAGVTRVRAGKKILTSPGVTETEQAEFLPRTMLLSFQAGADRFFWYTMTTLEKNPYDKEQWFGIIHPNYIPSLITGYPGHDVENITFSDMLIEIEGGSPACELAVPEHSGNYPYNRMFGLKIPAHAFYVRHARNVRLRNIQVKTIAADQRPAVIFDDATGTLENVDLANQGGPEGAPIWADKAGAVELRGGNQRVPVQLQFAQAVQDLSGAPVQALPIPEDR